MSNYQPTLEQVEEWRKEFEALAVLHTININRRDMTGASGDYCNGLVEVAWRIYLAAKTADAEQWQVLQKRVAELEATITAEPYLYLRMLDGKPDWSEDCVSIDKDSLMTDCPDDEEYSVLPLYAKLTKENYI